MADDDRITRSASRPSSMRLPLFAAPTTGPEHNTVRPGLRSVACFLIGAPGFDFDSSFIVPVMKQELFELAKLLAAHPGCRLSLFGHADPTGMDDYNKELSGRRAIGVYGLLVRDTALWERLFSSSSPVIGDDWSRRHILMMLQVIPRPGEGAPYYTGPLHGGFSLESDRAIRAFQADHQLAVDGDPGPMTRAQLFRAYMDFLCRDHDADTEITLTPADFLAGGADPDGKGDYQGCGEFNPAMVLSQDEVASLPKDSRDQENQINRRVVIYLFERGSRIDPGRWPCPTAREGSASCRSRFFSDGEARRAAAPQRRTFDETTDTFACRFYHRIAATSPCERPTSCPLDLDLLFDVPQRGKDVEEVFQLVSEDGRYDRTLSRAAAIRARDQLQLLRYTRVLPGKRYSLFQIFAEQRIPVFQGVPIERIDDFGAEPPALQPPPAVPPRPERERPRPDSSDELLRDHPDDHPDDLALSDAPPDEIGAA